MKNIEKQTDEKQVNILELLKNEKVEWKKLGEIAIVGTGSSNTNEQVENGKYPFYVRSKSIKRINKFEFDEEAIIIPGEGGVGEIFHYIKGKYALHQRAYRIHIVSNLITTKYVYHYMKNNFKKFINRNMVSATVSSIRKPMIENFEIPIPSLEIQEKIVKILDKFTKYVIELQAELQARTKQYNYYRDMLLSEEYLTKITEKINSEKEYPIRLTTLGDIGKFTRGNGLQKKDFREKGKPVIHYGEIYTKYGFSAEKTYSFTEEEIYSKLRKAKPNDILMATTSENIEDVGKSVVWLGNEEIGFSGDMYSFSTEENSKYIAYYFQTANFQRQKERKVTGTKLIRIHADDIEKFEIPLPPLEIQNKVVLILDKFQKLLNETNGLLPEEIEQRRKQYEFYREKFLTFEIECDKASKQASNNSIISKEFFKFLHQGAESVGVDIEDKVEWEKLEEVCKIKNGRDWKKLNEGNIPVYGSGGEMGVYVDKYSYNKPTVLIPRKGSIENVFYLDKPFWNVDTIFYTEINNNKIIPKYFYYFIQNFNIKSLSTDSTRPSITQSVLNKLMIPIPSLEVQKYIVEILDKFHNLINDISQGLPKEIELREKQYIYYREKLLSFKK